MLTSADTPNPADGLRISARGLAAVVVAAAIGLSSIVFSEPAIADAMMIAVMVAVPVLGVVRFGRMAIVNLVMWAALVALGVAAAGVRYH